MLPIKNMGHLSDADLSDLAGMAAMAEAGRRIREAGYDCKHVYRAWASSESGRKLGGEPCEAAIFVDNKDAPFTAVFNDRVLVVDAGW